MAESRPKRRFFDSNRGKSSNGRFSTRGRSWSNRRRSINEALAIPNDAQAATGGGRRSMSTTNSNVRNQPNQQPAISNVGGQQVQPQMPQTEGIQLSQQQQKPQRQGHGRKRRRHRNASFSGSDKNSGYTLPPAIAAALAIPPKTPESSDQHVVETFEQTPKKALDPASVKRQQPKDQQQPQNNQQLQPSALSLPAGAESSAAGPDVSKKKKRKTRRKRRWKPYYKLTIEERRELEEREEKRAERIRAERFKHGQPVAPYNTTQFLLRDRELRNGGEDCGNLEEIVRNIRHHTRSGSYESPGAVGASDSGGGSSDSDYSYLEREFDQDWLDEQRQRLETMSKDNLVKEFMDLQKQYESAQRDMRSQRLAFEEQLANLRKENQQLKSRDVTLTTTVPSSDSHAIKIEPDGITTESSGIASGADARDEDAGVRTGLNQGNASVETDTNETVIVRVNIRTD